MISILILVDIDECASAPCLNCSECLNQINGFKCICPAGSPGAFCESGLYVIVNMCGCTYYVQLLRCYLTVHLLFGEFEYIFGVGGVKISKRILKSIYQGSLALRGIRFDPWGEVGARWGQHVVMASIHHLPANTILLVM